MGSRIGCRGDDRSDFINTVCDYLNSFLSSMGCDPIRPDPSAECFVDDDCQDAELCDGNVCIPDPDDCRNDQGICDPWQS